MSAKNKFMTKALAVVLSASMALSLSSATALTANAAAAPKLAKKTVSVKAGKKAKNKLKAASYKAGWRITKATVKKTAVAKAKVKKNKKVVVVTGVKKGATKIVLKLKNAKTGAAKKLKFKAKVKVDKPVIEEPVVETASLVSVKQTAADTAVITFDRVPDTDVTIDTLKIYEGGKEFVPTAVVTAADKLSVTVTYAFAESTDTSSYTYTFKDANLAGEVSFTTGKYEVAKVVVEDQTVEAGSLQPVKYALQTAEGMDVTKYGDFPGLVLVEFTGDDVVDQNTSVSNPQVYLAESGKTCTFTVTFKAGQEGEIKAQATITAVQPTKTEAEARFAKNKDRWYLDDENSASYDYFTGDEDQFVFFYGKIADDNKALGFRAVEYADFDAKSSVEKVATAEVVESNSKYAKIQIVPGEVGTTTVTLTATENKGGYEIPSTFTFTVRVTDFNNNATQLYTASSALTLSNAYDVDYAADNKVKFALKNSNDQIVEGAYELTAYKGNEETTDIIIGNPTPSTENKQESWNLAETTIYAPGAAAGTYRLEIKATGISGSDTKEFKKTVNITVKDVCKSITADNNAFKYEIALSETALGLWDTKAEMTSDISVKALKNGLFAGYVRCAGNNDYYVGSYKDQSDVWTTNVAGPETLGLFVLSGAKYVTLTDGKFNLTGTTIAAKDAYATPNAIWESSNSRKNTKTLGAVDIVTGNQAIYYFGNGNGNNSGIANAGSYKVVAYDVPFDDVTNKYNILKEDGKEVVKPIASAKTFTVAYDLTSPKIDYDKVAGNIYASPDKDFLDDEVNQNVIDICCSIVEEKADPKTNKKAVYSKNYAQAKKEGKTVDWWINHNSVDSPAAGTTVYGVSILYTDRALNHGWGDPTPIHFVVLNQTKITE